MTGGRAPHSVVDNASHENKMASITTTKTSEMSIITHRFVVYLRRGGDLRHGYGRVMRGTGPQPGHEPGQGGRRHEWRSWGHEHGHG